MKHIKPIQDSIKAIQHEPEYTVHRYFARRPHNVIHNLISYYLPEESNLVFDPFGGGGTMLYESLVCGQRSIACDTSDLAAFIIEQEALMAGANLEVLSEFVDNLMKDLETNFSQLYTIDDSEVYWIEWSSYIQCPNCGETVFLSPFNTIGAGKYTCSKCNENFRPKCVNADQIKPKEICCMQKGSIRSGKATNQIRSAPSMEKLDNFYTHLCDGLCSMGLANALKPVTEIPDCNLQRESALHKKGFLYFEQFIPTASRGIITYIGNYITASTLTDLQKRQLIFVLSASLRYCSRFSTLNKAWRGDKPMEWAKSNFWTPYTFVEVNPIITFFERWQSYCFASQNAKKKFIVPPTSGSCSEVVQEKKSFSVNNISSEKVKDLPDSCVDLVITDPPYGSYLHYGELSAFWTTWLSKFLPDIKSVPDRVPEAVPARKKGYPGWKDFHEYEVLLTNIFTESYRVLKNEHYCVVTFNNKEPEAWIAFLRAVKKAGFLLPKGGIIFQDGVEAYKKSIDSRRGGAIFGDFVYSFFKDVSSTPLNIKNSKNWEDNLDKNLKELRKKHSEITNASLYTQIYLELLPELYDSIDCYSANTNYIEGLDFNAFENKIKEYYEYNNGIWTSLK